MLFGLVERKFKVDVASASECGLVRKENQDHFVADPKALVFCVADGMGGGEAGGEASEVVCRNVSAVLHDYASFADRVRLVDDAIHRADGEIRAISATAGYRHMGSTAAVLVSDGKRIAYLALSHVLTRAVGVGQERLKVDWHKVDVVDGDVLLLCSDGVHGSITPSALADAVSAGGGAKDILDRICALVLAAGARDNYSAIVVKIGGRR